MFDAIAKNISNFSRYWSKSYPALDPCDSYANVSRQGEDGAFCLSLGCILFRNSVAKSKK